KLSRGLRQWFISYSHCKSVNPEIFSTWGNPERSVVRINAPLQWSVEGGIGLQYHFSPSFSIYAEPSFEYFFNPGSDIKTIRQEKPFDFTIPIGLRLTW
ncbi:MAG: hypothetical protein K2J49_09905, partial [Muribaculaceae bacterium]|nr:hypothetical protein [Muribaculaceae bacterium]